MNENLKNLVALSVNSFIAYIFSYLVILIPSQLITLIVAKSFNIPVYLNHFKIAFQIADYSSLWTQSSVVGIYISAPIFIIITGFFFRYFRTFLATNIHSINLFLIWGYAHCMNIFFGGLIVGIPLIKGFGLVPAWLYFPFFIQLLLIAASAFILLLNSYILGRYFVALSFSEYYLKNSSSQLAFKIIVVIFPCILANSIFFVTKMPDNSLYESLLLATMFIQLIGTIPNNHLYIEVKDENKNVIFSKRMLIWFIGMIIFLFIFRIIINH
jgi:hypothetical protein